MDFVHYLDSKQVYLTSDEVDFVLIMVIFCFGGCKVLGIADVDKSSCVGVGYVLTW